MSDPQQIRPSRIRPRDNNEQLQGPGSSSSPQSNSGGQSDESAAAPADSARPAADDQPADAQPLSEQVTKKPRRSVDFACHLNRLAIVEMQLVLQCLDPQSKLKAARCSRSLLQAADHPFAWKGPSVDLSSYNQPQLGSLIRQSLLRHDSIALTVDVSLTAAEVGAVPRLDELIISPLCPADFALEVLALPSLQRLQTLRVVTLLPESALRLLSTLPALHTLQCWELGDLADWSWLPAMPALTDLDLADSKFVFLSQAAVDAVGRCARLQSLRLCDPRFSAGVFARLCSTPSMRRLRHLQLEGTQSLNGAWNAEAFSALAQLESLKLTDVYGVDRLLPHLALAPALRTLTIACSADDSDFKEVHGSRNPSREALQQLLTAAPRLEVRLEVTSSIERWRDSDWYRHIRTPQGVGPWLELQRMGAEMERVTAVDVA